MIIQIRGTSGSGKSTVMKRVMERLGPAEAQYIVGRKKPQTYKYNGLIYVLGHYESACGGCDTIGSARAVYELIETLRHGPDRARHILCEGLLLSEDVKWSSQLPDLRVIYLTTPLETCLAQIKQRRAAVGNEKELNPKNTTNRLAVIERSRVKLKELGVVCVRNSSDQAVDTILRWLKG